MNANDVIQALALAGRAIVLWIQPEVRSCETSRFDNLDKIAIAGLRVSEVETRQRAGATFPTATRLLERRLSRLIAPAPKAAIWSRPPAIMTSLRKWII